MSQQPVTIPKQPVLKPSGDFFRLRRDGIGFIEEMVSRHWTDYNLHDPGITILEALCYALTDLAYRIGWDIKDILAPATPPAVPGQPFPNQAFFTAREILTVNPCTPDDFRRLLIDLETVRNAWIICKECACGLQYYAWCEEEQIRLSDTRPANPLLHPQLVKPRGLYDVLLELEPDPELGDLNDRKVGHTYSVYDDEGRPHGVELELRFPEWKKEKFNEWKLLLASTDAFASRNGQSFTLNITKFNRTSDKSDTTSMTDAELRKYWQNLFYITFEIQLQPGGEKISIENATLRIFGDTIAKNQATVSSLTDIFDDRNASGIIQRYRAKLIKVEQAVAGAKALLHAHRNLNEDYCRIGGVNIEDVAVCADVEVAPDADIERVQARIWFEIARYFNPPVPFYSLQELVNEGTPTEEIFNGPALSNGFIKAGDLEAAGLKTVLRTSDIINRLMDIEGVIAVNNLLLTKYDMLGHPVKGASDPTFTQANPQTPIFDPVKSSASWLLYISELHQPRLYINLSRFLFYKNGLPFLPRTDEAFDTLTQLQGEAERPKIKDAVNDLPVPAGTFRNPEDYYPVQYSLPRTYGTGTDGLPSHASPQRRARAKQLKAYLMVFEQMLGNAFAQIAHTADLFSLDPTVQQTYFTREFSEADIEGYTDLINGLNASALEEMTETVPEFYERRNRFLDHIMARFGEQFSEYALLLTNYQGQKTARERLVDDKISFLNGFPFISRNRAKAFNYVHDPLSPKNIAGLKKRVSLLLGYPDLSFSWTTSGTAPVTVTHYQLKDENGTIWLEGDITVTGGSEDLAKQKAFREIVVQMTLPAAYEIVPEGQQFRVRLNDRNDNPMGQHPVLFDTPDKAGALRDELSGWSSNERAMIVEHLLLRPKFPGDALFDPCLHDECTTCDDDLYSFRLTFVMPGWSEPFNVNLDMRRFADRTLRQETPAHLLGKICWTGNDGFIPNPCDPVVSDLADLLIRKGLTAAGNPPAEPETCTCAITLYTAFSEAFRMWYEDKTLDYFHSDALKEQLEQLFTGAVDPAHFSCAPVLEEALWTEIRALMESHFRQIVLNGWQFERFENAWHAWLTANAAIDWSEEYLQERVEALLLANVPSNPTTDQKAALCRCATAILMFWGTSFYHWMEANLKEGRIPKDFTPFDPDPVVLCPGFTFAPGTAEAIRDLLSERYTAYQEVSYRLRVVVSLLGKIRNTYPGATLHDCDEGSDQNPVRLGSTALGNYPMRRSAPTAAGSPGAGQPPEAAATGTENTTGPEPQKPKPNDT